MVWAFLSLMKNNGWGRIINFGSGSVFDGAKSQTHYVAAKAGIVGFPRSLAREVGDDGITVNVITPGLTVTKAVRDHFPEEILQTARYPAFASYQVSTSRRIPVVALTLRTHASQANGPSKET